METEVSQPIYRRVRFEDLEHLAALEAEVFADEPYPYLMLRQLYDIHGSEWLVAEVDARIVGYALMLEKAGRALLSTFAVASPYRGRGYGCGLLTQALAMCADLGVDLVYLTVRPDNHRAGSLFKRVGFELVGHDEQFFGGDAPRDILEYRPNGKSR